MLAEVNEPRLVGKIFPEKHSLVQNSCSKS